MTSLFEINVEGQLDPDKKYFDELVGDGKKFSDAEALARGKAESDGFIKTLNERADAMRAEITKLKEEADAKVQLRELIDQAKNSQQQQLSSNENPVNEEPKLPLYDPKEVETLIYSKIQETKKKEIEQTNYNTVVTKLKEKYGNKYPEFLSQKTQELGLTQESVESMARTMPQVLIKSLELDAPVQRTDSGPMRSMFRTDQFQPTGGAKRDHKYYEELRKKDFALWSDKKTTEQRFKDIVGMGEEAFYGEALNDV